MSAVIAPTDKMKDVLKRTTSEAKSAVNKVRMCVMCVMCALCVYHV